MRAEINPRLAAIDPKTPYGAFQRAWRQVHCQVLNPYGSESCPYQTHECLKAYLETAIDALNAETSKIGLFRVLARRRAYDRADNKPLARERDEAGDRGRGDPPRQGMHGAGSGPVRIGTLLGSLDTRTRQRSEHEGEEGSG